MTLQAALSIFIQFASPIRVELAFIVVLGTLWGIGRASGSIYTRKRTSPSFHGRGIAPGSSTRPKQASAKVERRAHAPHSAYTHPITTAIRVGQIDEALRLIREYKQRGTTINAAVLASTIKACTSKRQFTEGLAVYDSMAEDATSTFSDKSVWSCLLFCAMEAKSYSCCTMFFERIKACGTPSVKDYGHMVRYASLQNMWQFSLQILGEMNTNHIDIDSVVYNTILATCVAANQVDEARKLLEEMERIDGVTDVITYNTLMKGYAKADRMAECFDLYKSMGMRGIAPSQVTYGILLDGCINANQVDKAAEVFDSMIRDGCKMNTVLFTTLIKGFVRAGEVDQAMKVSEKMNVEGSVSPDLITYSILIKANCDVGRLGEALGLLQSMLERGIQPDEVVFNNLLTGCVHQPNMEVAKKIYRDMVESDIQPTSATFSIMIRLFAQSKALEEAVDFLRTEPARHKQQPEQRIFAQLIQCCLRERQGRRAIEVYDMMCAHALPTAAINSSIIATCVKLNMFDTAVEFLSGAADHGARVDQRDADTVLEAARKKRRLQCIDACIAAMERLGLHAKCLQYAARPEGPSRPRHSARCCAA